MAERAPGIDFANLPAPDESILVTWGVARFAGTRATKT